MVWHGVRVAKSGKSGEAKSLFIRQNTGKTPVKVALYMWAERECPAYFIRDFAFSSTFPIPWNREKQGLKHFY